MPDQTLSDLYQKAVLWAATGRTDAYGGPVVDIPQQILVRWVWGFSNKLDPKRDIVTVDATIDAPPLGPFSASVLAAGQDTSDIPVGSLLWLGSLGDITGTSGPTDNNGNPLAVVQGLCQVKTFKHTPDIDNRFVKRSVGVIRYKGPLPTLPGVG